MSSTTSQPRRTAAPVTFHDALALHRNGRVDEAKAAYRSVLAREPRHPDATALLGVALVQSGAPEEGIHALARAVELQPTNPTFLYNLGVAYEKAGRIEEAQTAHERATKADPALWTAWTARGSALRRLGRWDEAVACCRKAVELTPDDASAWNELGVSLDRAGDLEGAASALREAALRDSGHALAATNLAAVLARLGETDSAQASTTLRLLWQHVQAAPEDPARWTAFTETFMSVSVHEPRTAEELLPVLLACLEHEGVDHRRLTRVGLSIVRTHPSTSALMEAAARGDAAVDTLLERDANWAALAQPVIRLLLERTIVPDTAWERLFTRARRRIAVAFAAGPSAATTPPGVVETAFAIACQSHNNGYVWSWDDAETAAVEGFVPTMAGRDLGAEPGDRLRVAVLAGYVPLLQWERAGEVLVWSERDADPRLDQLVTQQIREPVQEETLQELVPTFGELVTDVSSRVRAMYEEHPYPRWLSLNAMRSLPAAEALRAQFPWARTERLAATPGPRVLVAGCGTGQHLLGAASRFQGARVTGVDLSRASLAYAIRKAAELGFADVSVVQADILALDAWTEPFDIVECAGVLHHMEDPMAGWRVLERLLVPGGFMKIGLYSELARRLVVEARAYIAEQGWDATAEDIRAARPQLARHFGDEPDGSPVRWRDFFSMHECRDLLFHVQEHRFTIPQIAGALSALGLEFVGWEGLPGAAQEQFRARFPEPDAQRSLEAWHRFETEQPGTFASMYQFWAWKPLDGRRTP